MKTDREGERLRGRGGKGREAEGVNGAEGWRRFNWLKGWTMRSWKEIEGQKEVFRVMVPFTTT